uniref:IS110 family transposase n=1 Tax=Rhodococcus erythropolis TaxID=1833 RepID=UPI00345E076D
MRSNPHAVTRYRVRHGQAGGKSDSGDAAILANIFRSDRDAPRTLPSITEHARAVKVLARHTKQPCGLSTRR